MRADAYLAQNGYFPSRNKAAEAILRGEVIANGKEIKKPSQEMNTDDVVEISDLAANFASNGGFKLQKAFDDFKLNVENLKCVDVGASNGGFTDCLLRHGAARVYAIDVGENQFSESLANDTRVVVIDNFNARGLDVDTLGEKVNFATCDVSFISLTYVLKPIYDVLTDDGAAVVLIKPQFECGKRQINKNGIVTDEKDRRNAVEKICDFAVAIGFFVAGVTNAPIKKDKNVEYLAFLKKEKVYESNDFL